jgi:predicted TIM-barrel fold metal-dependent hydrolase
VIALDHGARPRLEGGPPYAAVDELFALAAYQGVFLKITSVTISRADREPGGDARKLIRRLAEGFGADHLAWGSNFPASQGSLSELRHTASAAISELSADEQSSFLGGTAARIYPRLAV